MAAEQLRIHAHPRLHNSNMILGFAGWMDGGDVSTGTVDWLIRSLNAQPLASIEPGPFYIYNFPGSMEIAALFRPHTHIKNGLISELQLPANDFYADPANNLILFRGQEPNLRWSEFAQCLFDLAAQFDVKRIYFIGSVAGAVPHTREPRLACSASDETFRDQLQQYRVRYADYQGPASFTTYMTKLAPQHGMQMASLVAEIPAYVQGINPVCIESVTRRLAAMLSLQIKLDKLREASDEFEKKLNQVVQQRPELSEFIQKLEAAYDNEIFDTQLSDLKEWLEQKGVTLD